MVGTFKAIFVLMLGFLATQAGAASVTNPPFADTTLIGVAPTNNNGAQAWVLAGRIQNNYINRALLKFDLSNLPSNALILSVAFNIEVTRVPDEPPADSTFGLHRMLRSWGEGNKDAQLPDRPGQGLPATAGEATWLCAFFPTNEWSVPGGGSGLDFSSTESSFQFIGDLGSYRFESTPELVADVQDWVEHPASNFGWILLCNDEETILTARRFASREDPDAHPTLEIEYVAPLQIESAGLVGDQFAIKFMAWPGQNYALEYRDDLTSGTWQTLTNLGMVTNPVKLSATDDVAPPHRFYRITAF